MGEWDDLFAPPAKPEQIDMSAKARRARAGMPAEGGTKDPNPSGPELGYMESAAGRVAPGRLPAYPYVPPGQAAPIPDPHKFRNEMRPPTELEGDPSLQAMTAGAMAAPLGAGAAGVIGKVAGPTAQMLARPAVGALQGAATSKMAGGSAKEGAALGSIFSIGPALEDVGAAMSNRSAMLDAGVTQDLSRYATPPQIDQMRRIGYAKTAETARKYGVVGAKDPVQAQQSVQAGQAAVGSEIGNIYSTIGSDYARPTSGPLTRLTQRAQARRGTVGGNQIADAIDEQIEKLSKVHGGNSGTMTLQKLRSELSDAQKIGYGGEKYGVLDPKAQKIVQREVAGALQEELDAGLDMASKDPRYAAEVSRLPDLNGTYRALKVLDNVTGRVATQAMKVRPLEAGERARSILMPWAQKPSGTVAPKLPSGKRLGTVGVEQSESGGALSPGLGAALARPDRNQNDINLAVGAALLGQ